MHNVRGITVRVPFFVSEKTKEAVFNKLPGVEFQYSLNTTVTEHDHPDLWMQRKVAHAMLVKFFGEKEYKGILDVGTSLLAAEFIRLNKFVIGCECSTNGYMTVKDGIEELKSRKINNFLLCTCKAQDCTHCGMVITQNMIDFNRSNWLARLERYLQGHGDVVPVEAVLPKTTAPDVALWMHSVYHNTPMDIARTLLRTVKKVGYAVYHVFPNMKGRIGEATYRVLNGQVQMSVNGNTHWYQHDNVDWITGKTSKKIVIETAFNTQTYYLVWSAEKLYRDTHFCKFRLVRLAPSDFGMNTPTGACAYFQDDLTDEMHATVKSPYKTLGVYDGKRLSIKVDVKNLPIRMGRSNNYSYTFSYPTDVVGKLQAYLGISYEHGDKVNKALNSKAVGLLKAAHKKGEFDIMSLPESLAVLNTYLLRRATQTVPLLQLNNTYRAVRNRNLYNEARKLIKNKSLLSTLFTRFMVSVFWCLYDVIIYALHHPYLIISFLFVLYIGYANCEGVDTVGNGSVHCPYNPWQYSKDYCDFADASGFQDLNPLIPWKWNVLRDLCLQKCHAEEFGELVDWTYVSDYFANSSSYNRRMSLFMIFESFTLFILLGFAIERYWKRRHERRVKYRQRISDWAVDSELWDNFEGWDFADPGNNFDFIEYEASTAEQNERRLLWTPEEWVDNIEWHLDTWEPPAEPLPTFEESMEAFLAEYTGPAALAANALVFSLPSSALGFDGLVPVSSWRIGLIVGVAWLLILIIKLLWKATKAPEFDDWEFVSDEVESGNTIPNVGSYRMPVGAHLMKRESEYEYKKEVRQGAKVVRKRCVEVEDVKPAKGVEARGVIFDAAFPKTFLPSQHNVDVATYTRVTKNVPKPIDGTWTKLSEKYADEFKEFVIDRFLFKGRKVTADELLVEYVDRYPLAKRVRILHANQRIIRGDWEMRDTVYECFMKWEKEMKLGIGWQETVRPRVISAVSDAFKAIGGPFLMLYTYEMKRNWHWKHHIFYASGVTNDEMTGWARHHHERLGAVVFLYSDFSKYDMTQGADCIASENDWYRKLGFGIDDNEEEYLYRKLNSTLLFGALIIYIDGLRKSGDNDTSSGNTRNTVLIIFAILTRLFGEDFVKDGDYAIGALGDDNITMIPVNYVQNLTVDELKRAAEEVATELGVKIKISMTEEPTEAEFLSKRLYESAEGLYFGCKPGRIMAKLGWFLAKDHKDPLGCFYGALYSMGPIMRNVPFARVYYDVCTQWLTNQGVSPVLSDYYRIDRNKSTMGEVDDETWAGFTDVYGFNVDDEAEFRSKLTKHVNKFGMPSCCSDEMVTSLFERDRASF